MYQFVLFFLSRNLYTCPKKGPKHLAVAVNKWKYRLIYKNYFGGVTALSKEQFEDINGFSNSFYGWGGEDDDLFHRVDEKKWEIFRYPGNIARFSMLKHDKASIVTMQTTYARPGLFRKYKSPIPSCDGSTYFSGLQFNGS